MTPERALIREYIGVFGDALTGLWRLCWGFFSWLLGGADSS